MVSMPITYKICVAREREDGEGTEEFSFFLIIIQIIIFCVKFAILAYIPIIAENGCVFKLKMLDVGDEKKACWRKKRSKCKKRRNKYAKNSLDLFEKGEKMFFGASF